MKNYQYLSHTHCFDQQNPACGLKGYHCCLCDIVSKECVNRKDCKKCGYISGKGGVWCDEHTPVVSKGEEKKCECGCNGGPNNKYCETHLCSKECAWYRGIDFECNGKNGMTDSHAGTHFKQGKGLCTQCGRDYEYCLSNRSKAEVSDFETTQKEIAEKHGIMSREQYFSYGKKHDYLREIYEFQGDADDAYNLIHNIQEPSWWEKDSHTCPPWIKALVAKKQHERTKHRENQKCLCRRESPDHGAEVWMLF